MSTWSQCQIRRDHALAPPSDSKSSLSPVLLTYSSTSEVPTPRLSVPLVCQSGSQNWEKRCIYWIPSLFWKDVTQEQPDGRGGQGEVWGQEVELPWAHSAPPSPNLHVSTDPEALRTLSFWVIWDASLRRHDWLNHGPWVTDSPLEVWGWTTSSNPLITCSFWEPVPSPGPSLSHFISISSVV